MQSVFLQSSFTQSLKTGFAAMVLVSNLATIGALAYEPTVSERKSMQDRVVKLSAQLKVHPRSTDLLDTRSDLYSRLGQNDLAISDINRAVYLAPNSAKLYYSRLTIETMQKHYDAALKDANEAIKLQPNNEEYLEAKGMVLGCMGKNEDCLLIFERCIKLKPSSDLYELKSRTLARLHRYREAMDAANKSLELNPNNHRVSEFRSEILTADPSIPNLSGTK